MTDKVTRMRDAGRSWTEIAERLHISVFDAKQRVERDKVTRRVAMSKTAEAEERNGLRDLCTCGGMRKEHQDLTGVCSHCGPERAQYRVTNWDTGEETYHDERQTRPDGIDKLAWSCNKVWYGCNEFFAKHRSNPLWNVAWDEPDPAYVDPYVQTSKRLSWAAAQLGVQQKINGVGTYRRWEAPQVQQPTLSRMVRRARRKLAKGKPVKKHFDRPRRGNW